MSFPPIVTEENQAVLHTLDSNDTPKHLPLRKRHSPILHWQSVESPEEQMHPYPTTTTTTYPENEVLFEMKRPIDDDSSEQLIKKVKRGRPSTKHLIKVEQLQKFPGPSPEEKNTLYCICKRPYDIPRFMIACDRCDQWFHGECINISEKQGEFIDFYFCQNCSKITGKKTIWKPKCDNMNCERAARIGRNQGHLSKYCTDNCGLQVAKTRMEITETKNSLSRGKLCSFADMDDRSRLSRVKDERMYAKSMIQLCLHKENFLHMATTTRLEDDDRCGFDSRLSWPDTIWQKVNRLDDQMKLLNDKDELVTAKPFTVCSVVAKKCGKHVNWHKLKESEIEQEKTEQFVIMTMLERERQQIRARMKKRREDIDLSEYLEHGTVQHLK